MNVRHHTLAIMALLTLGCETKAEDAPVVIEHAGVRARCTVRRSRPTMLWIAIQVSPEQ